MKRFTKKTFFRLLIDDKSNRLNALEKAYNGLANTLFTECASASDRAGLYNALCYAAAELKSLQSDCSSSKKKRCL
jgi:hypothetical protein